MLVQSLRTEEGNGAYDVVQSADVKADLHNR